MLGSSKSKPQGCGLSNDIFNYRTATRSEAKRTAPLAQRARVVDSSINSGMS